MLGLDHNASATPVDPSGSSDFFLQMPGGGGGESSGAPMMGFDSPTGSPRDSWGEPQYPHQGLSALPGSHASHSPARGGRFGHHTSPSLMGPPPVANENPFIPMAAHAEAAAEDEREAASMLGRSDSCDSSMAMDPSSFANDMFADAASLPATPRKGAVAGASPAQGHYEVMAAEAPTGRFEQDFEVIRHLGSGEWCACVGVR